MNYRIFTATETRDCFMVDGPERLDEWTVCLPEGWTQHSLQEWQSGALDTKKDAVLYSGLPGYYHHIPAKTLSALAPRDIRGVTTVLYLKLRDPEAEAEYDEMIARALGLKDEE